MKFNKDTKKLTLSAMFLALTFVLPFITGQIPTFGVMLCPMHIPVLLCGFFCGAPWGLVVGLLAPILRSAILSSPQMFPMAIAMAFELATYGFVAGWLNSKLQKRKRSVYISLISAMIMGRLVWGGVMFSFMGFDAAKFGFSAFLTGAVLNAVLGIFLQLVLVPTLVIGLNRDLR